MRVRNWKAGFHPQGYSPEVGWWLAILRQQMTQVVLLDGEHCPLYSIPSVPLLSQHFQDHLLSDKSIKKTKYFLSKVMYSCFQQSSEKITGTESALHNAHAVWHITSSNPNNPHVWIFYRNTDGGVWLKRR